MKGLLKRGGDSPVHPACLLVYLCYMVSNGLFGVGRRSKKIMSLFGFDAPWEVTGIGQIGRLVGSTKTETDRLSPSSGTPARWQIWELPRLCYGAGWVTVLDFIVTAVCANNLPLIVAPVSSVIDV